MSNSVQDMIRGGTRITHLLNIKISKEPTNIGSQLRQDIYNWLNNKEHSVRIQDYDITILWKSTASSSSEYYADIPLFTNQVIKEHTRAIMTRLKDYLNNRTYAEHCFTREQERSELVFIVTKTLLREEMDLEQFDILNS